jgi:hypothetical protein
MNLTAGCYNGYVEELQETMDNTPPTRHVSFQCSKPPASEMESSDES